MSTIGKNNNIGSTHGKNINKVKCLYVRVQKHNLKMLNILRLEPSHKAIEDCNHFY
jgi:hypothetical protein